VHANAMIFPHNTPGSNPGDRTPKFVQILIYTGTDGRPWRSPSTCTFLTTLT
jgi:hypothetical protein